MEEEWQIIKDYDNYSVSNLEWRTILYNNQSINKTTNIG